MFPLTGVSCWVPVFDPQPNNPGRSGRIGDPTCGYSQGEAGQGEAGLTAGRRHRLKGTKGLGGSQPSGSLAFLA